MSFKTLMDECADKFGFREARYFASLTLEWPLPDIMTNFPVAYTVLGLPVDLNDKDGARTLYSLVRADFEPYTGDNRLRTYQFQPLIEICNEEVVVSVIKDFNDLIDDIASDPANGACVTSTKAEDFEAGMNDRAFARMVNNFRLVAEASDIGFFQIREQCLYPHILDELIYQDNEALNENYPLFRHPVLKRG